MKSQAGMFCAFFLGLHALIFFSEIFGNSTGAFARKVNYRTRAAKHQMRYRMEKPKLLGPLHNVTVHLGKTAVFRCVITGSPSRIQWRKNNVIVPHTRRFRTRSYSWGGLLRIRNVKVTDYGTYVCKATNSLGQITSNFARLTITGVNPLHTERCEVYAGKLCSAHLRKAERYFIPFGQTQQEIENKVQDTFRRMSSFLSLRCQKHLLPSLCKHYFSPCDPAAAKPKPVRMCKEDCIQLQQEMCSESFTIAKAMSVKLRHQLPICSSLPKENKQNNPTNCQKIFPPKNKTESSETSEGDTNENQAEILQTLFSIISGIPQDSETSEQSPKNKDSIPVITDDQKFKGKCEPYVGAVCSQHIRAGQNIFISENRTQLGYETKLTNSLALVISFTSTHCRKFALKALCYYFFPPCQDDNLTPNLICRRDCEVLEARICSKEFQYARTMPVAGEIIPDCSFLPVKQDVCLELDVPDYISDDLRKHLCSTGLRSQGKLIPRRPRLLRNSSEWCKTDYRETSSNLFPTVLKKELKRFGQDCSTIGFGNLKSEEGAMLGYCVRLMDQTPQKLLNDSYMKTVTLPNMVRPHSSVAVPGLVVKLNMNKAYFAEIPLGFLPVYRPHKYLKLDDVRFSYRLTKTHNTFVGQGLYQLCGTNFSVEIKRTKFDSVRINGRSLDPVDVNTIEKVFGVPHLSGKLLEILKKYGVFLLRILKPTMEMYVGETLSTKFSGISFVENLKTNAKIEVIAGKPNQRYLFTTGLIFEGIPLGKIISSFSGVYLRHLDMFQTNGGKNKIGLSLSAYQVDVTNIPFMAYTSEPLASSFTTTIPSGLYFAAQTGTPKNCRVDQTLCRFIQIVIGKDVNFTLTGQTSWQWVHFKASIRNTALKNHFPVEKVEIEMKASNKTGLTFGIQPHFAFKVNGDVFVSKQKSNKIVFKGTLFYTTAGRQLTGRVKSNAVWKKAFGFPQLTIHRMAARFSIRLVRPYFPNKLVTRADFEVGLHCNYGYRSNCITGTAYIGMSDEVNEQYFHGIISRFNIQDILRVHGVHASLPGPIATIGFPDGLEVTFAKHNHNLRSIGGPLIKPGFTMKGKIRVLGFESECSVNLKTNEFIVDADITGNQGPIKLGGVTPLYRSRHDRKNGPKLYLETRFSPKPYVKAYIDGYTRIFGIFDEVRILMTRRHFQIRLVTSIFKSFKVRINVMANYSEDLSRTHFKAKIVFIGGLAKLTRASSKHVIAILKNEQLKFQAARNEMDSLKSECQSEGKTLCDNCLASSSCRSKLHSCKNYLKARGERRTFVRSNSAKHLCQRLVRENCDLEHENCTFVCKNSSAIGSNPCKSFDQSKRTVEDMKKSLFWVNQAKVIFSSNLCHIHSITFDTRLRPDDIGDIYVNARLDLTLFGHRQRIDGVRLKFGIFARLASDIAKHAVDWYRKSKT